MLSFGLSLHILPSCLRGKESFYSPADIMKARNEIRVIKAIHMWDICASVLKHTSAVLFQPLPVHPFLQTTSEATTDI